MSCRRVTVIIGLLAPILAGGTLMAAEAQSEKGASISAAQQELKSFQSPKQLQMQGAEKLELPKINHSQLSESPAPALISPLKREQLLEQQKQEKKSKNWLVDAMLKPVGKSKSSDTESLGDKEDDPTLDPFEKLIAEQQQRDPKAKEAATREADDRQSELVASAVNPLNTYMPGWISPRDRELLAGNTPTAASGGGRGSAISPWESPQAMAFSKPDSGALRMDGPSAFRSELSAEKFENPYLAMPEALVVPSPSSPALADPVLSPSESRYTPKAEPNRPTTVESKSVGQPGLSRQDEDARYFPQLKRF